MTLKRTLESSAENAEEETLNNEEETSTLAGQEKKNEIDNEEETSINESDESDDDSEDEESIEELRLKLESAETDRDNYKKGMLAAKGKNRSIEEPKAKAEKVDVNEAAVEAVLAKKTEKQALINTITSGHKDYIPELVTESQYQEIIGYLPRNLDKTSYESVVRGLKLATKMWKEDRGIKETKSSKATDLSTTKSKTSSTAKAEKKTGRSILKGTSGVDTWY